MRSERLLWELFRIVPCDGNHRHVERWCVSWRTGVRYTRWVEKNNEIPIVGVRTQTRTQTPK